MPSTKSGGAAANGKKAKLREGDGAAGDGRPTRRIAEGNTTQATRRTRAGPAAEGTPPGERADYAAIPQPRQSRIPRFFPYANPLQSLPYIIVAASVSEWKRGGMRFPAHESGNELRDEFYGMEPCLEFGQFSAPTAREFLSPGQRPGIRWPATRPEGLRPHWTLSRPFRPERIRNHHTRPLAWAEELCAVGAEKSANVYKLANLQARAFQPMKAETKFVTNFTGWKARATFGCGCRVEKYSARLGPARAAGGYA